MLYALLFTASLSIFSSFSNAEPLPIYNPSVPAATLPGYEESLNLSPAFHVLQNDPELAEFASQKYPNGQWVTDLCIPSSMANLLLYQASQKKEKWGGLRIPGLIPGSKTVEGASVVKDLIDRCQFEPSTAKNPGAGVGWFDSQRPNAINCLSEIYRNSGYDQAKITYIRNKFKNQVDPRLVGRNPTLADIQSAFQEGDEVLAMFSYQVEDPATGLWRETGSHSVNLFGYSANSADAGNSMVVYLQNSNRLYSMDFKTPVFDTALFTLNHDLRSTPAESSLIEVSTLQGRLINFDGKRTFLAGLLIIHINSP